MATTNDFYEWLDSNDLENYDDVDSLYRTVSELTNYGIFSIAEAKGQDNGWILTHEHDEDTLHILTEKACQTFLSIIESRCCDGMSEEAWYAFHRAMEKEN